MRHTLSMLILTGCLTCSTLPGDVVQVNGANRTGTQVEEITETEVVLNGERLPRSGISSFHFSSVELPQGRTGILLKNGTRLSGSLLERSKKQVVFYSVTAGELDIAMTDIAGFFYEPEDEWRKKKAAIPGLMTRTGEVVPARRILWADMDSAAVLTENGLQRFPAYSVSRVWWAETKAPPFLQLRNGDILNVPVSFEGKQFRFTLLGKEHRLTLQAVRTITFTNNPDSTP